MEHSQLDSSVRGILQARILEWVVISFSRGSSPPRDQTHLLHWQAVSLPLSLLGSPLQGKQCLGALGLNSVLEGNLVGKGERDSDRCTESTVCRRCCLGPLTAHSGKAFLFCCPPWPYRKWCRSGDLFGELCSFTTFFILPTTWKTKFCILTKSLF